jgi:opacity protein-like surface antigen
MKTLATILLLLTTACATTSKPTLEVSAGSRYFDAPVADLNYETSVGLSYLASPEMLGPLELEVSVSRFSDRVEYSGNNGSVVGADLSAGVRYGRQFGCVIPYVGAGVSGTHVAPSTDSGVTWKDDTTLGTYLRAGIKFPLSDKAYIGFDARYVDADTFSHQLYDMDGEVLSVTFGTMH